MKIINKYKKSLLIITCIAIYGCNSGANVTSNSQKIGTMGNIAQNVRDTMRLKQSYLNRPYSIVTDKMGNVYMAMADQNLIQKISYSNNTISTIAGNGSVGKPMTGKLAITQPLNLIAKVNHDGLSNEGSNSRYGSIILDSEDNVYIADSGNSEIEKVDHNTGLMTVIAGGGSLSPANGLQATSVQLNSPTGVAIDTNNNLYIADNGNILVEEVDLTKGTMTIIAGGGNGTPSTTLQSSTAVSIMPYGIATDNQGNVYITDQLNNSVEKINTSLQNLDLEVIAGNGRGGLPIPGKATNSPLGNSIDGLALDNSDNVYVADSSNNEIEKISKLGYLSIIAGTGQDGFPYSANPATSNLSKPHAVTVDNSGELYIADTYNQIVEKYSPTSNNFYINYGAGFIRLVGAFQCVNDPITNNKCGCLYDPKSNYIWYAGIKTDTLTNWLTNGSAITTFNRKNHCGLNTFHLPNITSPAWNGNPYWLQPILVTDQNPGGDLSSLVMAAETKNGDTKATFHLLDNGFYTDTQNTSSFEDIYWLNNSSGLYSYTSESFGWGLVNYDTSSNGNMVAEPQVYINNNTNIIGKVLLVSD